MEKEQSDRISEDNIAENNISEHSENENNKEPDKGKHDNKSSKLLLYSVIFIIILFAGLIYYNQYSISSKLDTVHNSITGKDVTGLIEDNYYYKNIEFKLIEGLWYFTLYNEKTGRHYNIPLHYGPREVIDVPLKGKLSDNFIKDEQVFLSFVPEYGSTERQAYIALASAELTYNLRQAINRKVVPACAENITIVCETKPIITCDNTDMAVIFLKYDDETKVEFDDNCVIIQGKEKELTRAVDRLLLYWYEILDY